MRYLWLVLLLLVGCSESLSVRYERALNILEMERRESEYWLELIHDISESYSESPEDTDYTEVIAEFQEIMRKQVACVEIARTRVDKIRKEFEKEIDELTQLAEDDAKLLAKELNNTTSENTDTSDLTD